MLKDGGYNDHVVSLFTGEAALKQGLVVLSRIIARMIVDTTVLDGARDDKQLPVTSTAQPQDTSPGKSRVRTPGNSCSRPKPAKPSGTGIPGLNT